MLQKQKTFNVERGKAGCNVESTKEERDVNEGTSEGNNVSFRSGRLVSCSTRFRRQNLGINGMQA